MISVPQFKLFAESLLIKHGIGDETEFLIQKKGDIESFILHVFSIKHFSVSKHLTPTTRSFWASIDFFGDIQLTARFTKKEVTLTSSFDFLPSIEQEGILYIERFQFPCKTFERINDIRLKNRVKLLVSPDYFLPYSDIFTTSELIQAQKDLHTLLSLQINHIKADYLSYLQTIHHEMIKIIEK